MKILKSAITSLLIVFVINTNAQKIKLIEGDVEGLKNDTAFNFEFTYDNMSVGRYEKEAEFISTKTLALNEKEAGRGDAWAKKWVNWRKEDYEPKFIDLFNTFIGTNANTEAKHTIIIHTSSTEPGYDAMGGLGFSSGSAIINAEITIVETVNRSKKIAVITIDKAKGAAGATFSGTTKADGSLRLTEAYATAGKGIAKFLKQEWK